MSLIIVKGMEIDSKKDAVTNVILIVNQSDLKRIKGNETELKISLKEEPTLTINNVEILCISDNEKITSLISNDNKSNSEVI